MKPNLLRTKWRFLLPAICISFLSNQANAQLNCSYAYGDSYAAVSGIQAWEFGHSGSAGNFSGSSIDNGNGDSNSDGDISSSTAAWGLYANSGGLANQFASFDIPFTTGDIINLSMDNGYQDFGSSVGFGLQNEIGENLFEFYFVGGESAYTINGDAGPALTTIGYTDEGLSVTLTLNTPTELGISVVELATATTTSYTASLIAASGGQAIKRLRLFNSNAGNGGSNDAYFNNLTVCQSAIDSDGDGWYTDLDCNDTNYDVNPGVAEILFNGIDDDCNPTTLDYDSGIFQSFVILDQYYDMLGNTDNPNYYGTNLGTFYCGDQYFLQGAQHKTFKCPGYNEVDITGSKMYYRLTLAGQPYGGFTEIPMSFVSDDGEEYGCLNQTWELNNAGIDLLIGAVPGEYVLDIYTTADYTSLAGSGTVVADNNGVLYRAGFIYAADIIKPVAICNDFNLVLGENGTGILEVDDINNGSTDNCGIASMSLSQTTFSCEDLPTEPFTADELIISEYVSGQFSDNYLELFNGTPNAIDLSNYELRLYINGQSTPWSTDNLSPGGILAPNEAIVFGNSNSTSYTGQKTTLPNYSVLFQGQESVELFNITTNQRVDLFGAIGDYPIPAWEVGGNSAKLKTLRRLSSVTEGNVNAPTGFPTLGTEWTQFPLADYSGLGSHDFDYNTGDPSFGIKLYVIDETGNQGQCTSNVTFGISLTAAVCNNITVELDEDGEATITAEDLYDDASSSCSTYTYSASKTEFNCVDIGVNTVVLTITDLNGVESTCDATVTVVDNILPSAICQNISVALDENGNASITADDIDNGSNDACGISSISASPLSFDINHIGANAVTLTVTDNNGNTNVCEATVNITGNVAPEAVCSNITVSLDSNGSATIEGSDVDGGSNALSGIASLSVTPSLFDCSNIGDNTVILTVTDNNGVTATCEATVTIWDTEAPSANCNDVTITMGLDGSAILSMEDVNNGSSDNCSIASMELSQTTFNCGDIPAEVPAGELIISEYIHGTIITGGGIFIINNYIELYNGTPVAIDLANYQLRRYTTSATLPDATDPLGAGGILEPGGTIVLSQFFGTTYEEEQLELQNMTMIYNGGQAMELYNISTNQRVDLIGALGEMPPNGWNVNGFSTKQHTLRRLPNITQGITESLPGFPSLGTEWEQFPIDEMSGLGSHVSSSGITPTFGVILTVNDETGNSSTCVSNVTFDYTAPELTCSNFTLTLDETGNGVLTPLDVVSDILTGCGVDTVVVSQTDFTCADIGQTTVVVTVVDVYENISTCSAIVTIVDSAPTVLCKDISIELDEFGQASITAADVDSGTFDTCSAVELTVSPSTFDCSNSGINNVVLTATDINGNSSTCSAVVTVSNPFGPTAICQDIILELDETGNATLDPALLNNGSTDNCTATLLFSASQTIFDYSNLGPNTIELTVTNENGMTDVCQSVVTVIGNIAPIAVCQNTTVYLDENGNATIAATDIDGGSSAILGIASLFASQTTFDCSNVGDNTVTLTVTDINGNVSTCDATVTVVDNEAPAAVCQDVVVHLDENGVATLTADDLDGGSTDNCGISSMTLDQTTFDCSDMGSTAVYASDLFISEYVEGSANNKYIEIYNGTGLDIDLSAYSLKLYSNGGSSPNTTSSLGTAGILASGEVVVFKNASATVYSGTAFNNSAIGYNGDDAIALYNGTTAIDIIGSIGQDPGSNWSVNGNVTSEQSLRRNADVIQGNTLNDIGFPSLGTEWSSASQNNVSDLGQHTSDAGASNSGGGVSVTLTVTDAAGNSSTCTANVTVEDNAGPTTICQDITVYLDESGEATITAADVDGGSFDNCGEVSLSVDRDLFTCTDIASESTGNQAWINEFHSDNAGGDVNEFIEVVANFDASNYEIDLYNGNGGSVYNNYTLGTAASSANGYNFYLLSLATNDIQNGPDGIALSDGNGNLVEFISYGGDFTGNGGPAAGVTSTDVGVTESSAAIGESLQRIGNGGQGSSFNWSGPANDSPGTINENQSIGSGLATTVELTSIDAFGNSSTCTATVTVIDNLAPNVVCQNITVNLDENGTANISADDIDNGSSDNCGIETLAIDIDSFDCSNVGVVNVTLTATDVNGNTASCTAQVSVVDNTNPTALCQEITVELGADGTVTISPEDMNNGSTDNCGISSMELSQTSFSCADLPSAAPSVGDQVWINELHYDNDGSDVNEGVEVVANFDISGYSVVAYNGSNGTSYQTVTIGSGDIASSESGYDFYPIAMSGLQNGAPDGIALIDDAGAVVEFISYEGSFTATNGPASGSSSTDIGVSETSSTSSGHSLQMTGTGQVGSDFIWTGPASETFGAANNSQTFGGSNEGVTVDLTVTDNSGNQNTCSAIVNVIDLYAPDAICQNINIYLDENGMANISASDIDGGSTDNCSTTLTTSISQSAFDCSHLGENTVTLTVADASGNVSTCDATVTVVDSTIPTAICQNITVQLDENGTASISAEDVDNGSSDICGSVSLAIDNNNFDCSHAGANSVTLTVTDASGNTATCTATVDVIDGSAPTAVCQNAIVYLDANGTATLTAADIDNGSSDNCGVASLTVSQSMFDCSHAGENNVVLTATDSNGNESTCIAVVTVIDMVAPTAICQNVTIELDENNAATITVDDVDAGSTDNCGIATRTISQSAFDCSNMGENIVTLTVTDVNGNVSTCDAIINLIDPIAPTAICQNALILLDANGVATLDVNQINNGSFDNCGPVAITLSQNTFDCSHFGSNTVSMTVTDNFGNTSTCDALVTVIDNMAPNAVGQNLTISLDANGEASITAADLNNGSYDNCGIASISVNQTDFDCSDLGANTVVMTASDIFGNSSSFIAAVTVVDTYAPAVICQNKLVALDISGYAEVTVSQLVTSATDNCGIASLEITNGQTYFGCEDEGMSFAIEITAVDAAGNISTCSSTVTILSGIDSDGDGISNQCDFCLGDNSTGDTDGDGICDGDDTCPGSEDLLDYDAECDNELTIISGYLSANNGEIYCMNGPFSGLQLNISNGSTVRLSGSGTVNATVQANSTLEVMSGSNITFTNINVNWGANAMVVHSDAEVIYNGNFSPNGTVVNCGTITVKQLTVNYGKIFINNHTVEITDERKTSAISGELTNYGYIHTAGSMTSNWNGEIFNHCHIEINSNLELARNLRNYAFINVGLLTTLQYNGRVHQYDGAMFQTTSTNIQGRYVGYGSQNFVKIFDVTTIYWGAGFEGFTDVCDVDGFESIYTNNPLIGGATENCNVEIAISECNPVGNGATPNGLAIGSSDDTATNGSTDGSTLEGIVSSGKNGNTTASEIKIWPNPTNGEATLIFTPVTNDRVRIELYAIDGSLVASIFEGNVKNGVAHTEKLNLSAFENGVYFVRIVQNDHVQTKKIVFTR